MIMKENATNSYKCMSEMHRCFEYHCSVCILQNFIVISCLCYLAKCSGEKQFLLFIVSFLPYVFVYVQWNHLACLFRFKKCNIFLVFFFLPCLLKIWNIVWFAYMPLINIPLFYTWDDFNSNNMLFTSVFYSALNIITLY